MQSTAILFTAANEIALGSFELPEPGPGELLLQTRYTCVSPGTELRVLSGKQADLPAWPLIPGYALVGEVVARGAGTQIAEGTLVFCTGIGRSNLARTWGGHVAHAVISEERAFLIPAGVDPIEAAMAKLAAIAYHGARLSHPRPDETVAVVGLGPIGQLAARIHAAMGARVVAADVSARRVAEAQAARLEAYVVHGTLRDTLGATIPGGADVVVDATGAPHVIAQAFELAREMGWGDGAATSARYLVQGSYADVTVQIYPSLTFYKSTMIWKSSLNSGYFTTWAGNQTRNRWTFPTLWLLSKVFYPKREQLPSKVVGAASGCG